MSVRTIPLRCSSYKNVLHCLEGSTPPIWPSAYNASYLYYDCLRLSSFSFFRITADTKSATALQVSGVRSMTSTRFPGLMSVFIVCLKVLRLCSKPSQTKIVCNASSNLSPQNQHSGDCSFPYIYRYAEKHPCPVNA